MYQKIERKVLQQTTSLFRLTPKPPLSNLVTTEQEHISFKEITTPKSQLCKKQNQKKQRREKLKVTVPKKKKNDLLWSVIKRCKLKSEKTSKRYRKKKHRNSAEHTSSLHSPPIWISWEISLLLVPPPSMKNFLLSSSKNEMTIQGKEILEQTIEEVLETIQREYEWKVRIHTQPSLDEIETNRHYSHWKCSRLLGQKNETNQSCHAILLCNFQWKWWKTTLSQSILSRKWKGKAEKEVWKNWRSSINLLSRRMGRSLTSCEHHYLHWSHVALAHQLFKIRDWFFWQIHAQKQKTKLWLFTLRMVEMEPEMNSLAWYCTASNLSTMKKYSSSTLQNWWNKCFLSLSEDLQNCGSVILLEKRKLINSQQILPLKLKIGKVIFCFRGIYFPGDDW